MIIKILIEYHLEFLSLKGGCRGSSESTFVKMSNCWKSHFSANFCVLSSLAFKRVSFFVCIPVSLPCGAITSVIFSCVISCSYLPVA